MCSLHSRSPQKSFVMYIFIPSIQSSTVYWVKLTSICGPEILFLCVEKLKNDNDDNKGVRRNPATHTSQELQQKITFLSILSFYSHILWHHFLFLFHQDVFGPCCVLIVCWTALQFIWKWTETYISLVCTVWIAKFTHLNEWR